VGGPGYERKLWVNSGRADLKSLRGAGRFYHIRWEKLKPEQNWLYGDSVDLNPYAFSRNVSLRIIPNYHSYGWKGSADVKKANCDYEPVGTRKGINSDRGRFQPPLSYVPGSMKQKGLRNLSGEKPDGRGVAVSTRCGGPLGASWKKNVEAEVHGRGSSRASSHIGAMDCLGFA